MSDLQAQAEQALAELLPQPLVLRFARDVVDISGPQAVQYLQGQISADIEALAAGQSAMSFVLDPKGRVESLFRITRLADDEFLADVESGYGQALQESLVRFKLGTKAEFQLRQTWLLTVREMAVSSVAADGVAGGDATPTEIATAQGITVETLWPGNPAPSGSAPSGPAPSGSAPSGPALSSFDVLGSSNSEQAPELVSGQAPDHVPDQAELQTFEWLRTLYGLPVIGQEIQPGAIPNETGLLGVAVCFTKGCYRGQELVERIDARTGARRELCRVLSSEALTAAEPLLDQQGKEIGKVVSAVANPTKGTSVAFAVVQADAAAQSGESGLSYVVLPIVSQ